MQTKAPENKLVALLRQERESKENRPRVETVLEAARRRLEQERTRK